MNRVHPVLWPLQLAGAVTVYAAFLTCLAATFVAVAGYQLTTTLKETE